MCFYFLAAISLPSTSPRPRERVVVFGSEQKLKLVRYSGSDSAGDNVDRKSNPGFFFFLCSTEAPSIMH